jgi:diguanylate cyclase (GGDEF)-like protein/PAS domain S-box-containing protein
MHSLDPGLLVRHLYGTVSDFALMTTNLDGTVTSWGAGATSIFGFSADEMIGSNIAAVFTPEDIAAEVPQREREVATRSGRAVDFRWHTRKSGSRFWADGILTPIRDYTDQVVGYLKILRDITDQKRADDEMRRLATMDTLTGLSNRATFERHREEMIALASRNRQTLQLLLIDLDRFKEVNDTLGHDAGDRVLHEAAARIDKTRRGSDVVARLGGDEFAMLQLSPGADTAGGVVAEKLLDVLSKPFLIAGREVHISASIGIAVYPSDAIDSDELSKKADLALYQAKAEGRNCFHYFTPALDCAAHQRNSDLAELRRVTREKSFALVYQPIVDMLSGSTIAMEALLRLPNSPLAAYPVNEVIELAKENGLIADIGKWVFSESCRQLHRWRSAGIGQINIAINTCAPELLRPDYLSAIATNLEQFSLAPADIALELTEHEAIEADRSRSGVLESLRSQGFSIVLDDFGTGYSSLSYLRSLPVTSLKLDQSFLHEIPHHPDANAVTRAVVALAHELRLNVTAEGVERIEQAKFLLDVDCTAFQGYLLAGPLEADAALEWLSQVRQPAALLDIAPRVDG